MKRPPKDPPEQNVLDFEEAARRARDAGIERAVEHADAVEPGWSETAYRHLLTYARQRATFTAEDMRRAGEAAGVPLPPDKRAWGGVLARARHAGVIEVVGFTAAKDPKVHCSISRVWRAKP